MSGKLSLPIISLTATAWLVAGTNHSVGVAEGAEVTSPLPVNVVREYREKELRPQFQQLLAEYGRHKE